MADILVSLPAIASLFLIEVISRSYQNSAPFVFDTIRLLFVIVLSACPSMRTDIFLSCINITGYLCHTCPIWRQLPFNNRREHSVLIMMSIVVHLFLIYCALYTRCTIKFITDEFNGYVCRIAVFTVVLNSAVNSLPMICSSRISRIEGDQNINSRLSERPWDEPS